MLTKEKSPMPGKPGMFSIEEAAAAVAPGGATISPPLPPKQFMRGFRGLWGSASFKMFTLLL